MKGQAKAAKLACDLAIVTAWHTAVFGLRGYAGRLEKLDKYLGATKPSKRQTTDEMLAVFRQLAARNPIKITQIN